MPRFFRRTLIYTTWLAGGLLIAGCANHHIAPPSAAGTATQASEPVRSTPSHTAGQLKTAGRIIFAGFAMHSQSPAFVNDVLQAEALVKRIDPAALSLKLGNAAAGQTIDWPQATAENFAVVMGRMAEVVRPQDRVLLLFSTHSNPGLLNAAAGGKHLAPITPPMLSSALAGLGPVPTVVVISSCYSGSFIESLKAPNRVIVTATEPRGTSFKCAYDQRTPFSDALFGQPNANELSFQAWAAAAQKSVATQEKSRKLPASRPQVFVGDDAKAWANQPLSRWLTAP
jgi:hypothetical protein